jgi:hypothetical protein
VTKERWSQIRKNVLVYAIEAVTQTHYEHALPQEALKGMKLLEEATRKEQC